MATWICTRCKSKCVLVSQGLPTDCTQFDGPEAEWRSARFTPDALNEERIRGAINYPWESFMEEEPPLRCPICGESCYNLSGHECPDPWEGY